MISPFRINDCRSSFFLHLKKRVLKSIELRQKSSATVHYYNIENGELRVEKEKKDLRFLWTINIVPAVVLISGTYMDDSLGTVGMVC